MSTRTLLWSAVLRDVKADRTKAPAGFLTARARCEGFARFNRPLAIGGQFDRSAIMAAAVQVAKQHQLRFGCSWGEAMSVCLRAAWQAARKLRSATAH